MLIFFSSFFQTICYSRKKRPDAAVEPKHPPVRAAVHGMLPARSGQPHPLQVQAGTLLGQEGVDEQLLPEPSPGEVQFHHEPVQPQLRSRHVRQVDKQAEGPPGVDVCRAESGAHLHHPLRRSQGHEDDGTKRHFVHQLH